MYGALRDREVVRDRLPRDVRRAESVHGDRMSSVVGPAAEERGVHEPASGWIELRDEGVAVTAEPCGESLLSHWEVARAGSPDEVGASGLIDRDVERRLGVGAAEECRVDEARPVSLELRHEKVGLSFQGSVDHAVGGRELPRLRPACDIGVSGSVDGDRACAVVGRAPEVRAPDQLSPRIELRHEHVGRWTGDAVVAGDACPIAALGHERVAGLVALVRDRRRGEVGIAGVIDGEHFRTASSRPVKTKVEYAILRAAVRSASACDSAPAESAAARRVVSTRQARREKAVTRSAPGGICRAGSMQFAGPAPGAGRNAFPLEAERKQARREARSRLRPDFEVALEHVRAAAHEAPPVLPDPVSLICPLEDLRR